LRNDIICSIFLAGYPVNDFASRSEGIFWMNAIEFLNAGEMLAARSTIIRSWLASLPELPGAH